MLPARTAVVMLFLGDMLIRLLWIYVQYRGNVSAAMLVVDLRASLSRWRSNEVAQLFRPNVDEQIVYNASAGDGSAHWY